MEDIEGYRGTSLQLIHLAGAQIGDIIEVKKDNKTLKGALMPRTEFADEDYLVIKLRSGYNIGVRVNEGTKITVLEKGVKPSFRRPPIPGATPQLPNAYIISTGGTIASRVDYRTGGVEPALNAEDLYSIYPELSEIANIKASVLYSEFSENLTIDHWKGIAKTVAEAVKSGAEGIVICHGTDTMGYTAAALSFILQQPPIPIVLVGSQRSSDRPSSDAPSNLIGALKVSISAPFSGVFVAMHENTSDKYLAVHRGVRARKCHSSSRDTFKSINAPIVARFHLMEGNLQIIDNSLPPRTKRRDITLKDDLDENVSLIKFYPSMKPKFIDLIVESGVKGIIIEGTGLGHVSDKLYDPIKKGLKKGIFVGMTSQCLWGRVNLNVYYTGRDLIKMGVVPLEDMLPETALIKLMWVLGQTSEPSKVKELMLNNLIGEVSEARWFQVNDFS